MRHRPQGGLQATLRRAAHAAGAPSARSLDATFSHTDTHAARLGGEA